MSSDKHCCVPGCNESQGSKQVLHQFPNPIKERERFNKWLYAVGGDIIDLENERIYKYRRVCRKHFEEKYLCCNNKISNTAMPTLYMPGPLTLSKNTFSERKPMNLTQTYNDNILDPSTSTVECGSQATAVVSPPPTEQQVQEITMQSPASQTTVSGSGAAVVVTSPPTLRQERPRKIRNLIPCRTVAEGEDIPHGDFLAVAESNAESMRMLAAATQLQAEAAKMHAEAAKVQAEAAKLQAEAAKVQAEASLLLAQAANKIGDALILFASNNK